MLRAVIDIGTNSVKILIGDVNPGNREVTPIFERGIQTRLGSGFYQDRTLQPQPVLDTAQSCLEFLNIARVMGVEGFRILATSAAREARNPELLLDAVRAATGISVEIVSGEQEAGLAFRGVASDPRLAGRPLVILDVGGGSTEVILGEGERIVFQKSFPIGTVRLLEQFPPSDPPRIDNLQKCESWLRHYVGTEIRNTLQAHDGLLAGNAEWVATGGTSMLLARMTLGRDTFERRAIETCRIQAPELEALKNHLWNLPIEQRRKIPGLPANRADVILFGVSIFSELLSVFRVAHLGISTRGLRFGALLESWP